MNSSFLSEHIVGVLLDDTLSFGQLTVFAEYLGKIRGGKSSVLDGLEDQSYKDCVLVSDSSPKVYVLSRSTFNVRCLGCTHSVMHADEFSKLISLLNTPIDPKKEKLGIDATHLDFKERCKYMSLFRNLGLASSIVRNMNDGRFYITNCTEFDEEFQIHTEFMFQHRYDVTDKKEVKPTKTVRMPFSYEKLGDAKYELRVDVSLNGAVTHISVPLHKFNHLASNPEQTSTNRAGEPFPAFHLCYANRVYNHLLWNNKGEAVNSVVNNLTVGNLYFVKRKVFTVNGVELVDVRATELESGNYYCYPSNTESRVAIIICDSAFRKFCEYLLNNGMLYENTDSGRKAAINHSKALY